jgi:hypothetical protein
MNCNCIEEINEKLKEATGDSEAYIETSYAQMGNKFISFPLVQARYRKKKQDGTLKTKASSYQVVVTHCPFCGTPVTKES